MLVQGKKQCISPQGLGETDYAASTSGPGRDKIRVVLKMQNLVQWHSEIPCSTNVILQSGIQWYLTQQKGCSNSQVI